MNKDSLNSWADLANMTQGADIVVERVRLTNTNIAIEGRFALPQLALLTNEEQVFAMAFIKTHGSIKEMEQIFGLSYPSIKNRLNNISEKLALVEQGPQETKAEILKLLEAKKISASEALERIKKL